MEQEQQAAEQQPAAPATAIEAAMPAIEATPLSTQQRLLSLQRNVGNQAFGRMIDRWKAGKAVLAREDIPTEAEIKEAETWAAEGVRRGQGPDARRRRRRVQQRARWLRREVRPEGW